MGFLKIFLKVQVCVLQLNVELPFFFFSLSRRGSYLLNFWTVGEKLVFFILPPN